MARRRTRKASPEDAAEIAAGKGSARDKREAAVGVRKAFTSRRIKSRKHRTRMKRGQGD